MQWISVEKQLPNEMEINNPMNGWSEEVRPSEYVLCMTKYDVFKAFYSFVFKNWTRYDESVSYQNVTHWMPLPPLPKED